MFQTHPQGTQGPPPRILTVAGSDSGGGAGIQADLKTILALGGYGMSAVAALTAQNTIGVRGVHEVPADFVALQIDAIVADIGVDAAKTGMLASCAVIEAVADRVRHHGIRPLVVDPVMVAKSGDPLLADDARAAMRDVMLPLSTVVTPNLPEASELTGLEVAGREGMRDLACAVHQLGAEWVLLKGGHLEQGDPLDLLYDGSDFIEIVRPRIHTRNTHGTGCTYSAAVATGLGWGASVPEAVRWARDALQRALASSLALGEGHGPLNHRAMFDGSGAGTPRHPATRD